MTTNEILRQAKAAKADLLLLSEADKNLALQAMADAIEADCQEILSCNAEDVAAALQSVTELARKSKCEIRNLQAQRQTGGRYQLSFQAEFGRGKSKKRRQRFFEGLAHDPAVLAVRIVDEAIGVK